MLLERRRKRSNFVSLSLQYWLAAVARQRKLLAMILADSAGLLVASSFKGPEAEELAAMAPLLARPWDPESYPMMPKLPFTIHPIRVDRTSLYLCAIGDQHSGEACLKQAENGVRRILTIH